MSDTQGAASPPATTTETAPPAAPSGVAALLPANPSTELRVTTDKIQTASSPDASVPPDAWYAKATTDADTIGWLKAKNFPDLKTALASHRSLEQTIGMDRVAIPAKPDDPAWEQVDIKTGRPETPEAYGLDKVEGADPSFTAAMAQAMHQAGVSARHAVKLVEAHQAFAAEQQRLAAQRLDQDERQAVGNLHAEFGSRYDQETAFVARAQVAIGATDDELRRIRSVLGTERTIRMFIKYGKEIQEDAGVPGETVRQTTMLSPAAAEAKLKATRADPAWQARFNSGNQLVKEGANAELLPLYRIIHGE